jgi:hypothetical protein
LIGKSGRNTADASDTSASETNADATAHFILAARSVFKELRTPFPS